MSTSPLAPPAGLPVAPLCVSTPHVRCSYTAVSRGFPRELHSPAASLTGADVLCCPVAATSTRAPAQRRNCVDYLIQGWVSLSNGRLCDCCPPDANAGRALWSPTALFSSYVGPINNADSCPSNPALREGPYVSGTNCCGSVSHYMGPTPPGFAGPLVTLFAEEQSMQEQEGGLSDNCVESLRPP